MESSASETTDALRQHAVQSAPSERSAARPLDEVLGELRAAWRRSDALIALVRDDALPSRPLDDRPALLHELAHCAAVSHTLVCRRALGAEPLAGALDELLAVHGTRWTAPARWPKTAELRAYRDRARQAILDAAPRCAADTTPLQTALEHEWLHHELLLTMLWRLEGSQKSCPVDRRAPDFGQAAVRRPLKIPAGTTPCGAHGAVQAVEPFVIDSTPVMNGEYFEFVAAGAYTDERCWTPAGWSWRSRLGLRHPRCWRQLGRDWLWRGLFEDLPLTRVFDWPAIVGLAEAQAFLAWRGQRLPSEAEFCRVAYGTRSGGPRRHPWGDAEPDPSLANLGLARYTPVPVGSLLAGASDWGALDLLGNGWEWTVPVDERDGPGVLLGASWATAPGLVGRGRRWLVGDVGDGRFSKFRGVAVG